MNKTKAEIRQKTNKIIYTNGLLLIFLFCCLAGCSEKKEKAQDDLNEKYVYETERSGIGGRLKVPDSCEVELNTGDSGLDSILVDVAEIQVPETDRMKTAYLSVADVTTNTKKEIAELVFDKNSEIYKYDDDHMTKQDYILKIDHIKREKEGYGDSYSDSDALIEEYQKKESEASDTYEAAGDYNAGGFLGTYDGEMYTLSFTDANQAFYGAIATMKMYSANDTGTMSLRTQDNAYYAYCTYDPMSLEESNQTDMTKGEAETAAQEFIYQIECENMLETSIKDLQWVYLDDYFQEIETQNDGYVVRFSRAIGQVPIYKAGSLYNVSNLSKLLSSAEFEVPQETCDVYVYNGKVIQARLGILYEKGLKSERDVQLLEFKDMLNKAKIGLAEYYEKYPSQYSKVTFNHLELGYYVISESTDVRKAIPAWIFTSYDEMNDYDASLEPEEFAVVNAIDGSVVDVVEEGKIMGYYIKQ